MPSLHVPVSWLRDYVDIPISAQELGGRLHMSGSECERVERTGDEWERIYVARVSALEKHPNADLLTLATVDYGPGRTKTVVTGATNLGVGDVVAFAEAGARLRDGQTGEMVTLKPKPMRGIPSEGMVCSAKELGLGEDHDGILVLGGDLPVGAALRDVLGDDVLHLELQPNRPDCLSVLGIAREAAALLGTRLRHPPADALASGALDPAALSVRIHDEDACPRFAAALLEDVRGGASPPWMQERLRGAGMRPIDLIVDITNYVMLELGQPLHAYDAERVRGRLLVARKAGAGEPLRTLDGVQRRLDADTLVIADAERALGIAGILGGEDSEITPQTRTVALECASFEPRGIRRTAERHGLHGSSGSAAARRFGLELSRELVPLALGRAVRLLREHAGARLVGATDVYPRPATRRTVELPVSDLRRVLGVQIAEEDAVDALRRLEFECESAAGILRATAPAVRTDIGIAEDVVEEVARIVGYDVIPTRLPAGPLPPHEPHAFEAFRERLRDVLAGLGLHETISYSLIDPAWLGRLTPDGTPLAPEPLRVQNPTSLAQSVLRPTLRASLLDTAARNLRHQGGVGIFEIGPAYLARPGDLPEERWTAAILLAGRAERDTWLTKARDWDLHDLRGVVSAVHQTLRSSARGERVGGAPGLHAQRSFRIVLDGRDAVTLGQLDPAVAARWDLPAETFVAELDVAALAQDAEPVRAATPPRYPPALRDLAVVVDEPRPYGDVAGEIRAAAKGLLESVTLVDLYRGPQVGAGKKSIAVRLVLRSHETTLGEAEVERVMKRIEGRLLHQLGATIR